MKELNIEDIDLTGVRAVVFDLDGTLYDKRLLPLHLIMAYPRYALWLASERIARRRMRGQYFGDADTFYNTLLSYVCKWQHAEYDAVKEWYEELYMPSMVEILYEHYQANDFVLPLLRKLNKTGIKTAVFSDYGCVEEKVRAIGLEPKMFDYCVAAPELGGLKPNKELFNKLLKLMRVKPEETLMVGDRPDTDGKGAEAVGMRYLKV